MEIVMKVKCSPSPVAGATTSSLKIVDNQRQLQQRPGSTGYNKTNTPPQITTYIPPATNNKCLLSTTSCSECSMGYCCNLQTCCLPSSSPTSHQTLPTPPPLMPIQTSSYNSSNNPNSHGNVSEDLPEFVSIEDEKVKQYLMKIGQEQLKQQRKPYRNETTKVTHVIAGGFPSSRDPYASRPVVYEIIELDDESEREKLKQIKQQAELKLAAKSQYNQGNDMSFANRNTKSLNISLIPKPSEPSSSQKQQRTCTVRNDMKSNSLPSNHKIIAEINLIDSSDDEEYENEDDETLPLAAVSCELNCDDDDSSNSLLQRPPSQSSFNQVLQKANSKKASSNRSPEVESSNENLLVRWEEYEGQGRERVFFECFLCGKKVQSSYNLRRHMMIHTGERPFACDMCDRRFREFSDLKKHRRRHSAEPNFMCMVCGELPPIENDPTRCINCCTQSKNVILMASMKRIEETAKEEDNQPSEEVTIVSSTPSLVQTSKTSSTTVAGTTKYIQRPSLKVETCGPTSKTITDRRDVIQKSPTTSASSENTQRLLENIPAVLRPGHNQLGMITRKEFACPLCNRAFGTRHNLKRHYMIHTGTKPFSCTKCRKPFREYSTLKKHMVTHQRDRWYKCMQCPMKFRDFIKYTEHKDSHPTSDYEDREDRTYRTRYTTKSRSNYQSSDSYMDSNDEQSMSEDCLECCECGQQFNDIDSYNEHLEKHCNISEIYECYICKHRFQSRTTLEDHMMKKHKKDCDSDDELIA
ncbi:uncharacterized protein LOC142227153 [Haematobia irritans]|uniref:uncharacterized protein LOC142227153 n=1 Tax=Haematobia irritans TaxID=7368 RepID=UPI003F5054D6